MNAGLTLLEQYRAHDKLWFKKPELVDAFNRGEPPPSTQAIAAAPVVSKGAALIAAYSDYDPNWARSPELMDRFNRKLPPPVLPPARSQVPVFSVGQHSEARKCPFPMCFTPEAMTLLLNTVGARPPETGAKGFAPPQFIGFDLIEYDSIGSSGASGSVYTPTVSWGTERRNYHQGAREMRFWTGDIHSHPGGVSSPSLSSGPRRLGDLGYVEMVFEQNELMRYFLLPIITGSGTGNPTIHAWVCQRDVQRPMIADVRVCNVQEFPPNVFSDGSGWT